MRATALALALLGFAGASAAASRVRVRCTEGCTVKLDGKSGQKLEGQQWLFESVPPGSRIVDVASAGGKALCSQPFQVPDATDLELLACGPSWPIAVISQQGLKAPPSTASRVTVRCPDDCAIKVDGKTGLKIDSRQWRFERVEPGWRTVQATGWFDQSICSGSFQVPPAVELEVLACGSSGPVKVVRSKPLAPAAAAGPASTTPSLVHLHCGEPCDLKVLEGGARRRDDPRRWTVENVPPGKRRLEVAGDFGFDLFDGYLDVPPGVEATFALSGRTATLVDQKPLVSEARAGPAGKAEPKLHGPSQLRVRCEQPCAVYVDGKRRAEGTDGATVEGLTAGAHEVEVRSTTGGLLARKRLDVPAESAVYVTCGAQALAVTNVERISR